VDPEETSIARQRLGKHVSATTPNHGSIVGNGVCCGVYPECIYNEDPRPTELMIEKMRMLVDGWQFSCEERTCKSAAVKKRLYVCCSCSETVINPLPGYD
jgi:hypothetical protein